MLSDHQLNRRPASDGFFLSVWQRDRERAPVNFSTTRRGQGTPRQLALAGEFVSICDRRRAEALLA
jgi:hypothetical protein